MRASPAFRCICFAEVSRNWFARCRQTNDVFYFGEEVDDVESTSFGR